MKTPFLPGFVLQRAVFCSELFNFWQFFSRSKSVGDAEPCGMGGAAVSGHSCYDVGGLEDSVVLSLDGLVWACDRTCVLRSERTSFGASCPA